MRARSFAAWLAVASLGVACGKSPAPAAAGTAGQVSTGVTLSASDVTIARVATLTDAVSISGPLEPAQTVAVRSQINAIVRDVRADRGTHVRRGEVLVLLDAEGARGQAAGAKAAIDAADANLTLATHKLESAQRLATAGAISPRDVETAEAARKVAEAQLSAAAKAQLTTTSETESKATIVSPIDGIVSDRAVEPGEAVREGNVLLTVVEIRSLELHAQVDVDEAMRVKPGAPVIFTLDAALGESFHGHVSRIDPRADPATRQVGFEATLANEDGRIVAGQFAHGRVLTGSPSPQVVVPITALSDSSGHASVFVIKNKRLERRAVILGVRDEAQGLVAIQAGLVAGERLLAVPVLGAAEGLVVTMATDSASAQNGGSKGKPK